jgi:CBS domain-containing protein
MKLKEIMTREVETIHPNDTLQTAARKMRQRDIGFLPVYDGDKLIGVLSDRDIILRAVAEAVDPKTTVGRELITSPAIHCFEDQNIKEVAQIMNDHQIRRLVVLSRNNQQLVGVISLGDLAMNVDEKLSGKVLQGVSEPVE